MQISSEQVSVIVQGPIAFDHQGGVATHSTLTSIRRFLPKAQIILSTWKDSNIEGLDYDVLLLNKDPGAPKRPDGLPYNGNRLILSTKAGLLKANREYAIKIRTDCRLTSNRCLSLDRFSPRRAMHHHYFKERILAPELFFHNPAIFPTCHLFNISDIFHFGRTEDLLSLWDIPLQDNSISAPNWETWPTTPEQYIWLTFLSEKHRVNITLTHTCDFSISKASFSEISMMNNFAIYSCEQIGLEYPKRFLPKSDIHVVTSHREWRRMARFVHFPLLVTILMTRIYLERASRKYLPNLHRFLSRAKNGLNRRLKKLLNRQQM